MKQLLKFIQQWFESYEDDVTFVQRILKEQQQKKG